VSPLTPITSVFPTTRNVARSNAPESSEQSTIPPSTRELADLCATRIVGIGLSDRIVIVWHRGKAKINRLLRNALGTPTVHQTTGHFPCNIMVITIAYLTHDFRTLKACSLTCRGPAPSPSPQPGLRYARSLCGWFGKSHGICEGLPR